MRCTTTAVSPASPICGIHACLLLLSPAGAAITQGQVLTDVRTAAASTRPRPHAIALWPKASRCGLFLGCFKSTPEMVWWRESRPHGAPRPRRLPLREGQSRSRGHEWHRRLRACTVYSHCGYSYVWAGSRFRRATPYDARHTRAERAGHTRQLLRWRWVAALLRWGSESTGPWRGWHAIARPQLHPRARLHARLQARARPSTRRQGRGQCGQAKCGCTASAERARAWGKGWPDVGGHCAAWWRLVSLPFQTVTAQRRVVAFLTTGPMFAPGAGA